MLLTPPRHSTDSVLVLPASDHGQLVPNFEHCFSMRDDQTPTALDAGDQTVLGQLDFCQGVPDQAAACFHFTFDHFHRRDNYKYAATQTTEDFCPFLEKKILDKHNELDETNSPQSSPPR